MAENRKLHKISAGSGGTPGRWEVARRWSYGGLAVIAVVSLIGLIIAWSSHPPSNTLGYEFAKTCMQVLAVAVFGGLATIATFNFQHSRTQEDSELERGRRQLENDRVQRRREDDQLRSIMEETLDAYNRVKRIRRLLDAEARGGTLTLVAYDRYMADLIDQQLAFERLKRFTPFISDQRLRLPDRDTKASETGMTSQTLTKRYERIEKYLNQVIREYKEKRKSAAENSIVRLSDFDKLSGFVGREFGLHVSDQMDEIIDLLLKVLWQPLDSQ